MLLSKHLGFAFFPWWDCKFLCFHLSQTWHGFFHPLHFQARNCKSFKISRHIIQEINVLYPIDTFKYSISRFDLFNTLLCGGLKILIKLPILLDFFGLLWFVCLVCSKSWSSSVKSESGYLLFDASILKFFFLSPFNEWKYFDLVIEKSLKLNQNKWDKIIN